MKARTIGIVAAAGLAALVAGCKEKASPNCVHSDCTMEITPQSVVPAEGIFEKGMAGFDWSFGYNLERKDGSLMYQASNGEYVELDLTNVCWGNRKAQIHSICVGRIPFNKMVTEPATLTPRYCLDKAWDDQEAYQVNNPIFEAAARELSNFYDNYGGPKEEHCQ